MKKIWLGPSGHPICGHQDHPTFIRPIHIDFVGSTEGCCEEEIRNLACGDLHAMIFYDDCMVVTINEYCYGFWDRLDGKSQQGKVALWGTDYQISKRGLDAINEHERLNKA